MPDVLLPDAQDASARRLTLIIYLLYAAVFFTGITAIVAIVANYVKKDDMVGTLYESHFRWQIRTFWFALLWSTLSCILILLLIGYALLFAVSVWYIYRLVKGGLRLLDGKPMYETR